MSEKPDELNMDELDRASGGIGNGGVSGDLMGTKVQAITDQRSKLVDGISNMLKKFSDTASQIIGNLK